MNSQVLETRLEDLKGRTIRGGLAKLCGQAANFSLRLAFMVVLARLLDPEDFGLVAMVTVVTGFYDLFTSAGLSSATIQKSIITHEQVSTLFWINMLVGAMLALLCAVTAPALAAFYHEPRLFWVTIAMAAGFLFNAAGVQHFALLQRQLRYAALSVTQTLSQLATCAIGISMALSGFRYWALVAAAIASPAITSGLMWTITKWMPGRPRRQVEIRSMLRFGGTITLNGLVIYIAYNMDKMLLGRFWGPDALGVYGRAYQLVNIPTVNLSEALGGVTISALSRLQDDHARLKSYFLTSYSLVASITVPFTIFCALFADEIVLVVLGPRWSDAALIFRLLTPTVLVFGIINPTYWLLLALGLQRRSLAIALVLAPLVMLAYVVGLPYGPTGVAFGFSVALTLWLFPHIAWSLHKTIVRPRDILLATCRPFFASIVAAAIVYMVQVYFGEGQSPSLRLLLGGAAMAGLYFWVFLFAMGQKTLYFELLGSLRSPNIRSGLSGLVAQETTSR